GRLDPLAIPMESRPRWGGVNVELESVMKRLILVALLGVSVSACASAHMEWSAAKPGLTEEDLAGAKADCEVKLRAVADTFRNDRSGVQRMASTACTPRKV